MSSIPSHSGSFEERSVDASTVRTSMPDGTTGSTSSGVTISVRGSRSSSTTCRQAASDSNSRSGRYGIGFWVPSTTTADDHAAVGVLAFACGLDPADLTGGIVHDLPLVRTHGLHALGPARAPNAGGHRPGPLDQLAPAALPVVLHVDHHPAPGLQLPLDCATDHLLERVERLAVPPDQEPHLVGVLARQDVDVHDPVDEVVVDVRVEVHPVQQAEQELLGDLGLLLQVHAEILVQHPDPHDSVLRAEAQQPLLRLLNDLDPGLLLTDAELFEGGLDGLLNACGASFDFLHCASSCPRSSWFQLACPTGGSCPTYPSAPRSTPVAGRAASPAAARSATGSWSPSRPARRPRCRSRSPRGTPA